MVAEKFKTNHKEFIVKPNAIELQADAREAIREEPYADSSALPTYYVSKITRDYVTTPSTAMEVMKICGLWTLQCPKNLVFGMTK